MTAPVARGARHIGMSALVNSGAPDGRGVHRSRHSWRDCGTAQVTPSTRPDRSRRLGAEHLAWKAYCRLGFADLGGALHMSVYKVIASSVPARSPGRTPPPRRWPRHARRCAICAWPRSCDRTLTSATMVASPTGPDCQCRSSSKTAEELVPLRSRRRDRARLPSKLRCRTVDGEIAANCSLRGLTSRARRRRAVSAKPQPVVANTERSDRTTPTTPWTGKPTGM